MQCWLAKFQENFISLKTELYTGHNHGSFEANCKTPVYFWGNKNGPFSLLAKIKYA